MSNLKEQLIRLGSTNPELRPHLKPVLAELDRTASLPSVPANVSKEYCSYVAQIVERNFRGWDIERHGNVLHVFGYSHAGSERKTLIQFDLVEEKGGLYVQATSSQLGEGSSHSNVHDQDIMWKGIGDINRFMHAQIAWMAES